MPSYKIKGEITGWECWEHIAIGLVNIVDCPACKRLCNYNGVMPELCPDCGTEILNYYKGKDDTL
jgi:hypothetical protein